MPAWLLSGYLPESRLLEMLSIAHGDGRFAKTYSSWQKPMYWSWSTDCSYSVLTLACVASALVAVSHFSRMFGLWGFSTASMSQLTGAALFMNLNFYDDCFINIIIVI